MISALAGLTTVGSSLAWLWSAQHPISTLLMHVPWLSESVPQMENALGPAGANIGGSQAVGE